MPYGVLLHLFTQGVQISLVIGYNQLNRGTAFESGGADYAEWLKKYDENETLTYGDVVGVKAGEISARFLDAEKFMVISQNPTVTGAMPLQDEQYKYKKVAFIGQVPVKVLGEVHKGDYILPSGNGDGMAIAVHPDQMRLHDYKRIIGVAWDEYHGNELFSLINTAVGINTNDLSNELYGMQALLNQMQNALVAVNPNYTPNYFDVERVSVAVHEKTTKSKTIGELIAQQYGLDASISNEEKMMELQTMMDQKDLENVHFKFSDMPYLKEVLNNPTEENIEKYTAFYGKALGHLQAVVNSRTN